MTPNDPTPEAPPEAAALYPALLKAIDGAVLKHGDLAPAVAVCALIDYAVSLATASGALWESSDLINSLRSLADYLEAKREKEDPAALMASLREAAAAIAPAAPRQQL